MPDGELEQRESINIGTFLKFGILKWENTFKIMCLEYRYILYMLVGKEQLRKICVLVTEQHKL